MVYEAMAAQTQTVAFQNLPSLPVYTGEDRRVDDGFDHWVEKLKERSKLCKWTLEQELYQLKIHLDKTAAEVFWMLPAEDKVSFKKATKALGKRFRPMDIGGWSSTRVEKVWNSLGYPFSNLVGRHSLP